MRYIYQPGSAFPVHSHPEEQITIVLSGAIEFTVAGTSLVLSASETALIPANVPHGARVTGSEPVVTLNTMSPRRSAAPSVESTEEDIP